MSTAQETSTTPICITKFFTLAPADREYKNGRYGNGLSEIYYEKDVDQWLKSYILSGEYIDEKLVVTCSNKEKFILDAEPDLEMLKTLVYNDWLVWDSSFGQFDDDRTDYEPWGHVSTKALAKELNCLPEKELPDLDAMASTTYSFPKHLYFRQAPWRK